MMKRAYVKFATVLFGLAFLASASPAAVAQDDPVGKVVQQRGAVTVLRDMTPSLLLLGAPVFRSDRIVTGPDSRIKIEFADRSVLAIGSDSDITVDTFLTEQGNRVSAVLSMLFGIVRATITPASAQAGFDIKTRAAVASARSTDWIVEAKPDHTSVFVAEGEVAVIHRDGGGVVLTAGEGTDVIGDAPPKQPARWSDSRRQDAFARTRVP